MNATIFLFLAKFQPRWSKLGRIILRNPETLVKIMMEFLHVFHLLNLKCALLSFNSVFRNSYFTLCYFEYRGEAQKYLLALKFKSMESGVKMQILIKYFKQDYTIYFFKMQMSQIKYFS